MKDAHISRRSMLGSLAAGAALLAAGGAAAAAPGRFPVTLTDAEWRRRLRPAQYAVLRRGKTERAGSSPLDKEGRRGVFRCAGCAQPLFRSETKFDSGTGWPSFFAPIAGAVGTKPDRSLFITRTEVHCRRCGGHLGHLFDDGPAPTGKRYCMNGAAMTFAPA